MFHYSNPIDSQQFQRAQQLIPGGVNSPVRAFKGVGGEPIFFKRSDGAYLFTADDRQFIDYIGSWGPMVVGHRHPQVIQAVCEAAQHGLSFGAPTSAETDIATEVNKLMPSMQKLRFVNSGTEATMSALRLARAYTNRQKFIKFEGCYHGHADSFLVKAGSGMLTLGHPSSPGVPADLAQHTINAEYNNLQQVEQILQQHSQQIAAIFVEPIAGNMNCITPIAGFLQGLRRLADEYGCVLVFDEVMTGFRVALGGAQSLYQVQPDLTTIGKVIGGGMPIGAFGGKQDIMDLLAPLGAVYQAGTLSGNPVATAAGLATLKLIQEPNFFTQLNTKTETLLSGIVSIAEKHGYPCQTNHAGGMFGFFIGAEKPIEHFSQVAQFVNLYNQVFHRMLARGIYLAPSAYEAGFISIAHTEDDIDNTLQALDESLADIAQT